MNAILEQINPSLLTSSVKGMGQSATLVINEISNRLLNEGKHIYKLGLGQSPFPVPETVVDALRYNAHEKDYLPVKGLQALREAVAEFHRIKDKVDAIPDMVMIGPGSKELLFLLQLCFKGDTIIVSPSWVSYLPQAKILDKKVRILHTSFSANYRLTPALFRNFCEKVSDYKPRIMIMNYPGNPDGLTYTTNELKEIAELARQNNIIILSDEIYGELDHNGKHLSIATYYPEGTIISSGISKWCGAGGWRLGTFTFPKNLNWLVDAMSAVASETYTSVSAPIQYAAVRAFKSGQEIEDYLWHCRRILSQIGNNIAQKLINAKVKTHLPTGGFYLFLDFEDFRDSLKRIGISNSTELCNHLLHEIGVAALPGVVFNRPAEELSMRIAYVDFDGTKALTASRSIALDKPLPPEFTKDWCGNVYSAIDAIVNWLAKID